MKFLHFIGLKLRLHGEETAGVEGIGTEPANDSQATDTEVVVQYGLPEDAAAAETAEGSSDAPAEDTVDRNTEWNTVKQQYKDLFEADFKANLDRRLKGKDKELGSLKSIVDPLLKYFDLADINAMRAWIDSDIIPTLQDYTPPATTATDESDGDGAAQETAEAMPSTADLVNQGQALSEKLKAQDVAFDLQTELDNPAVDGLLKKGLNLEQAYTLAHHDEIVLRETQKAAKAQRAATIESIRTKGLDHVTEVASKPAPKVVHKTDPSTFTDEDFEIIRSRVLRGEKIRF